MPLTRKRATIWTCSDGTEHTDFGEAAEHEHEIQVKARLAEILADAIDSRDDLDIDQACDALFKNKRELGELFKKSRVAFKREAVPADRSTPTYGSDPRDLT